MKKQTIIIVLAIVFSILLLAAGLQWLNKRVDLYLLIDKQVTSTKASGNRLPIELKSTYPRVINSTSNKSATLQYLAEFKQSPSYFCKKQTLKAQLACVGLSKDKSAALTLKAVAEATHIPPCTAAGNKNNAWYLAMALDQIMSSWPQLDVSLLEKKLQQSLVQCLEVLDDGSASLWHGRFTIGAEAFLVAAVLFDKGELLERAFYHFKQSVTALAITEGWPNGYNYWIQNRGLTFYLAVSAYLQSGKDQSLKKNIVDLAKRNGRWNIYMTRPDGKVQPTGDEGSRIDLRQESKKVIDLIAKITRDPAIATFADYIQNEHGRSSYYKDYYWLIPYVYEPDLEYVSTEKKGLSVFNGWLPNQAIFGKNYFNQIVFRTGWNTDDTFLLVNGGQQFSHHQHADAGHFSYFAKGKPVAVDGAFYKGNLSNNRLYYGMRSNSKNVPNISTAITNYQPTLLFKRLVEDGSQRFVMPHGSSISSVDLWAKRALKNGRYTRAHLVSYETGKTNKIQLDLTPSYFDYQTGEAKVLRTFLFSPNGNLTIKDEFNQTNAVIIDHINLPALKASLCIDGGKQHTIRLDNNINLEINSNGSPACDADFARKFNQNLQVQLVQQRKLSINKPWADGRFNILSVAAKELESKSSTTFTFNLSTP